jgi:competence protein ComEA
MASDDELKLDEVGDEASEDVPKKKFDIEGFVNKNRIPLAVFLLGTFLVGVGVLLFKNGYIGSTSSVEVIEDATSTVREKSEVVVEIAGAVEKSGVYTLSNEDRVNDLLIAAGGFSEDADRVWIEKMINRAAKLTDGQKMYSPTVDEHSTDKTANFPEGEETVLGTQGSSQTKHVNINSTTQSELESLWGIGPVYAQSIIEHRPYSSVEELLTKKILKQNVYERNKEFFVIY